MPVDVIAEKAGVGVGTLYRHFPTKEKLCEAIIFDRLSALRSTPRRWRTPRTRAAFFGFLEHVVEEGAAKRDLIVAVMGAGVEFEVAPPLSRTSCATPSACCWSGRKPPARCART